jgi:predicted dehydrogenase
VNVVAVSDKSKNALSKARSLGIKNTYTDYQELLKRSKNVDAVIISLPNSLHLESIQLAVEAGLDIFIEKPLAINVNEGKRIVNLIDTSGSKLMIGHCMRFIDAIEKMKEVFDEGRIGNLEIITIESIQNGPLSHGLIPKPVAEWWFDPEKSGGGVLLDIGYHLIDLFHFFANDSEVLFSHLDYKYNLPVEDGATVILNSYESSVRGVINVGWFEKITLPRFNFRLILHGDADFISSDELIPRNMYVHAIKEGMKNSFRKILRKRIHPLSYLYYYESYYKELEHFFRCIEEDVNPSVSAIDGLKILEIIDEAYTISNQKSVKVRSKIG